MKTKIILTVLIPVFLLLGVIGWIFTNGAGVEQEPAAPIEVLNIERIIVTKTGFELKVSNTGPETLTIAQMMVDDSVWNFGVSPSATLERFDKATVKVNYPWVQGDSHVIKLITENAIITE